MFLLCCSELQPLLRWSAIALTAFWRLPVVRGSLPISKLQEVLVGTFGVLDPAGQRVAAVLKQSCSKICICFSVILPLIHWLYTCHTSLKPWNVIIHDCWNVHLMHVGPSERSSRLGLTSQHLGIGRSCIIKLFNHAVLEVHLSQTHLKHVTITGQTGQTAQYSPFGKHISRLTASHSPWTRHASSSKFWSQKLPVTFSSNSGLRRMDINSARAVQGGRTSASNMVKNRGLTRCVHQKWGVDSWMMNMAVSEHASYPVLIAM